MHQNKIKVTPSQVSCCERCEDLSFRLQFIQLSLNVSDTYYAKAGNLKRDNYFY